MTTNTVGSSGTTGASSSSAASAASGLNLNASDFMNMMVTQLQNQDPLNPSDSNQLMSQMSAIGQMQASSTLQSTLQSLATQTQIGSASSLIGKQVTGIDSSKATVSGLVTSVHVAGTNVNLGLASGDTLSLGNITAIAPEPAHTGS